MIHTVKNFSIVNKAEVDVFLELSCFFDDPADVGNLMGGRFKREETYVYLWLIHVDVWHEISVKQLSFNWKKK